MSTEKGKIGDSVHAALNAEPEGPHPDAKGPGDQWPVEDRDDFDAPFEEGGDEPKGPDPAQWG
jgi:hypothetical protein